MSEFIPNIIKAASIRKNKAMGGTAVNLQKLVVAEGFWAEGNSYSTQPSGPNKENVRLEPVDKYAYIPTDGNSGNT